MPIVALVASAGGLPAFQEVLQVLPSDLPAAVIVLQHTSPEHPSMLAEVLQRASALPVAPARDGEQLGVARVLVAPPASHMLITPQLTVSLIMSGTFPPSRPSADLLLTSLALAAGRRAIAVVMTGGGQDGATGATAIHKHGGTVLATDQATSHMYSMPAATIARDSIDPAVIPVDRVAEAIIRLVLKPVATPQGPDDSLAQVHLHIDALVSPRPPEGTTHTVTPYP
jgi:two-component system chemotaxis response regulator CheB